MITECTGPEEPVNVGDELELRCVFLDIIPTSASWSRDGMVLSNGNGIEIIRVGGMSTLRINSVASSGNYTFITSNEAGSESREVQVQVQESGEEGKFNIQESVPSMNNSKGGQRVFAFCKLYVHLSIPMS